MAIFISAKTQKFEHVIPESKGTFSLEELQKYVGGYIEFAPRSPFALPEVHDKVVICNEEGRIHHLPLNELASRVCGQDLVGDVLICDFGEVE